MNGTYRMLLVTNSRVSYESESNVNVNCIKHSVIKKVITIFIQHLITVNYKKGFVIMFNWF